MPQFDFTKYSSQIFWFLICFAVLYFVVSKIILPRIALILKNRKEIIDNNLNESNRLESKINDLKIKTNLLRNKAIHQYQNKIDEVVKNIANKRDTTITDTKEKIEKLTKSSRQEVKDLIAKSEEQSKIAVQDIVKTIETQLFKI